MTTNISKNILVEDTKENYKSDSSKLLEDAIAKRNYKYADIAILLGVSDTLIYYNFMGKSQIQLWEIVVLYEYSIANLTPALIPPKASYSWHPHVLKDSIRKHTKFFDNCYSSEEKSEARKKLKLTINHLLAKSLAEAISSKKIKVNSIEEIDSSFIYKIKNEKGKHVSPWIIRFLYENYGVNLLECLFT